MRKDKHKIVAVSGGFDPIHIGHIRMINNAAKLGSVHVYVNSDRFLYRKKGYVFMPIQERIEIIANLKSVAKVILVIDEDNTVCKTLEKYKPDIFVNGGDRYGYEIPEVKICNKLKIKMLFEIGGEKIQSSSLLVKQLST